MAAPHPLAEYLKNKNKSEFARAIGFRFTQNLWMYLPRADGRPPRKQIGADLARRIVAATNGELDYNTLLGMPAAKKAA